VSEKIESLQTRYLNPNRSERKPQQIRVVLNGRDSSGKRFQEESLIVNISRRGAGLKTSHALEPGSLIELRFPAAQRTKIAKVIWCAPANNSEGYQAGVLVYKEHEG